MNDIADRDAGPALAPNERPMGTGKRWAILLGFAALVMGAALSVDHKNDARDAPPPNAAAPGPTSTPGSAAAPVTPAPPPGG